MVKFKAALVLLRAHKNKLEPSVAVLFEAQLLYALAESEGALGDYENQLIHAREGLALKPDDTEVVLGLLVTLSSAFTSVGKYSEALETQTRTLNLLNSSASTLDPRTIADTRSATLGIRCVTYSYLGKLRSGLEACTDALKVIDATDIEGRSALLKVVAQTSGRLGERKKALESGDELLHLAQNSHSVKREIDALVIVGGVLMQLGDKKEALGQYKRALTLFDNLVDPERKAQVLAGLGATYAEVGSRADALTYLEQSLKLVPPAKNPRLVASVLGTIGAIYESTGNYDQAFKSYSAALSLSKQETSFVVNDVEAELLLKIGSLYLSLGDNPKGIHFLTLALPSFKALEDTESVFVITNKVADALNLSGDTKNALEFYNRAVDLGNKLEGNEVAVTTLFIKAQVCYLSDNDTCAIEWLTKALAIERQINSPGAIAKLLRAIGTLQLSSGDCQSAMHNLEESLALARNLGDRQGEGSTLELIGTCNEKTGKPELALSNYDAAISIEETVRDSSTVREFKSNLGGESGFAFTRAILLNMQLGRTAQAFNLSERARARAFLDQLATGRLDLPSSDKTLPQKEQALRFELKDLRQKLRDRQVRSRIHQSGEVDNSIEDQIAAKQLEYENLINELELANNEYSSIIGVRPLELREIQRFLDKDTTLISYFLTDDSLIIFVVTDTSFNAVQVPVKQSEIINYIVEFRGFANKIEANAKSLDQLYKILLTPIEHLIKTRNVAIVPHATLHYLPFSALSTPSAVFGDNHNLSYLPSASVLPFILQKRKPVGRSLLAMAQTQAAGLPFLTYGRELVNYVARLYGTVPFVNKNATELLFRSRASQSSIIFLAAHGKLDSTSPLFSQIVLSPDRSDDGLLEVHEIYGLSLKTTSLVVLTACNTALGGHTEGDDIVGLNRAFIYAGSPTVLATLWSVPEKDTADLMRIFFKELKSGKSKAEALHVAQTEIKKIHPNPYYWAAFVLTGDPG